MTPTLHPRWERAAPWLAGTLLLALGLLGAVLLNRDHHQSAAVVQETVVGADNLARVRVALAQAHAAAIRVVSGDPTVDPTEPRLAVAEARRLLGEWTEGRSTLGGTALPLAPGGEVRDLISAYYDLLEELTQGLVNLPELTPLDVGVRFAQAERRARALEEVALGIVVETLRQDGAQHRRRVAGWLVVVALLAALVTLLGVARGRALRDRLAADRRYRSIVEHAPLGIAGTTPDGRVRTANRAFAALLGHASAPDLLAEAPSLPDDVYLDPSDRAALLEMFDRTGSLEGAEVRWRRKDGEVIWVRIHAVLKPPDEADEGSFLAFVSDITPERSLQDQLRHAQKMEAVGTLAGGIAHDFNNLLTPVLMHLDFALEDLDEEHPARRDLEEVRTQAMRATELTSRILSFSRKQEPVTRVVDLNEVMRGVESMLRRTIPKSIRIDMELDPAPCLARVDPGQLEQVLMNLVVNARDAMPDGGELQVESRRIVLDEAYAEAHLQVQPGAYVALDVSDTGHGMDAATLEKIFDPFFTTKAVGKGTGLGLSSVYGIVSGAGGHVRVYSEPGTGTLFRIYLPARDADGSVFPTADATRVERAPLRVSRILLVEDDTVIREAAVRSLARDGHRVVATGSAEDALAEFGNGAEPPALLLTDLVLPDASGRELAAQVRARSPGIRVLFMSGYTERSLAQRAHWTPEGAFIQKPFTPSELCRRVQDVLAGEDPGPPPSA
jgi:two-component system, cell cycle sensor histidine kinase and response regulator CckA